ncbi:hypothetical protein Tco_0903629 [Tanacetum coccineum]
MVALELNISRRALHESECLMKAQEVQTLEEIEKWLNESKMQTPEGMDGSSSSGYATYVERARDDKAVSDKENLDVGPSLDNNTLTEPKVYMNAGSAVLLTDCTGLQKLRAPGIQ